MSVGKVSHAYVIVAYSVLQNRSLVIIIMLRNSGGQCTDILYSGMKADNHMCMDEGRCGWGCECSDDNANACCK